MKHTRYILPLGEIVVHRRQTLRLALCGIGYESTHHIEFTPMNFGRIIGMEVIIPLVRANEIRYVDFPKG